MSSVIEAMARSLCKHACLGWSDEPDGNGDYFRDAARAALKAAAENVSERMVKAHWAAYNRTQRSGQNIRAEAIAAALLSETEE